MKPHSTLLTSPPAIGLDDRLEIEGLKYQHPVLKPRTLPIQDALGALPGLAKAVQKVLDPAKGVRFPGAVRATWLDTAELSTLYPELLLASVGALYQVADPLWVEPQQLVREYEGEMLVQELDGEFVRSHFRTLRSAPGVAPTLLLASASEMLTVYSHLMTSHTEDALIPLLALAGDSLTVGGFFIDKKRFQVTRGVPSGVHLHRCPEQVVRGLDGSRHLMHELSPSPWSRAYWPVSREGQLTWMTVTCFV